MIRRIVKDGVTVVLVEHDMRLVMNISDRIHVLANGRTLAEGTAERGACRSGGDPSLSGCSRLAGGCSCCRLKISQRLWPYRSAARRHDPCRGRRDCHVDRRQWRRQNNADARHLRRSADQRRQHPIEGEPIEQQPAHARVALGISQVPEGRQIVRASCRSRTT